MLRRKNLEVDVRIRVFGFHPLPRRPDHLFRRIASNNRYVYSAPGRAHLPRCRN